jgi:predicted metalloprotease with PDZ domain
MVAALVMALASVVAWGQSMPPAAGAKPANAELEAKLEAARARLEAAAREVGELSAQMGDTAIARVMRIDGARRAIIGVQLDPESGKDGARVQSVSPGGPAAEAGVRAGDVIVAVDGKSLGSGNDAGRALVEAVRAAKPEQKMKLRVLREGKTQEITVTPRARPVGFAFSRSGDGPMGMLPPLPPEMLSGGPDSVFDFLGSWRGELAGHELATVTPKLGSYFGVTEGVLVVRAPADSAYKLEDGDVIQLIDGRVPTSGAHALRILRSYQPGEKVQLKLLRQRKTMSVDVVVTERPTERKRVMFMPAGGATS